MNIHIYIYVYVYIYIHLVYIQMYIPRFSVSPALLCLVPCLPVCVAVAGSICLRCVHIAAVLLRSGILAEQVMLSSSQRVSKYGSLRFLVALHLTAGMARSG